MGTSAMLCRCCSKANHKTHTYNIPPAFAVITMADADFIAFVDDCLNWQLSEFPVLLHRSITDDEAAVFDLITWMVNSRGWRPAPTAVRSRIRT